MARPQPPPTQAQTLETVKVLCVDDEPAILRAMKRVLTHNHCEVTTTESAVYALQELNLTEFDVIISDMRMPELNGVEFLAAAANKAPSCRRILLTGYSDQDATVQAINKGNIYRYLAKPWDNDILCQTVRAAAEEKWLEEEKQQLFASTANLRSKADCLEDEVQRVNEELRTTTTSLNLAHNELQDYHTRTIQVFASLINMLTKQPSAMNQQIANQCEALACCFPLDIQVVHEIYNAALLYQIGKVGLPTELLTMPVELMNASQLEQYRCHPDMAVQALLSLEPLHYAATLIRHQDEHVDGSGWPDQVQDRAIPLGSRIIKLVKDYNQRMFGLMTGKPEPAEEVLSWIAQQLGTVYDREVFTHFQDLLINEAPIGDDAWQDLTVEELHPGMICAEDIYSEGGVLILARNTKLTDNLIKRLHQHEMTYRIKLCIPVTWFESPLPGVNN